MEIRVGLFLFGFFSGVSIPAHVVSRCNFLINWRFGKPALARASAVIIVYSVFWRSQRSFNSLCFYEASLPCGWCLTSEKHLRPAWWLRVHIQKFEGTDPSVFFFFFTIIFFLFTAVSWKGNIHIKLDDKRWTNLITQLSGAFLQVDPQISTSCLDEITVKASLWARLNWIAIHLAFPALKAMIETLHRSPEGRDNAMWKLLREWKNIPLICNKLPWKVWIKIS